MLKRKKLSDKQKEILFTIFEIKYNEGFSFEYIFDSLKFLNFNKEFVKSLDLIISKLKQGASLKNAIENEWKNLFNKDEFIFILKSMDGADKGQEKYLTELKRYYNLKNLNFENL